MQVVDTVFSVDSYHSPLGRCGPQADVNAVHAKISGVFAAHQNLELDGVLYMVFFFERKLFEKLFNLSRYLCFCACVGGEPMCESIDAEKEYIRRGVPYFKSIKKDQYDNQTKIFRRDCFKIAVITRLMQNKQLTYTA
jgi:hypothetical protein